MQFEIIRWFLEILNNYPLIFSLPVVISYSPRYSLPLETDMMVIEQKTKIKKQFGFQSVSLQGYSVLKKKYIIMNR